MVIFRLRNRPLESYTQKPLIFSGGKCAFHVGKNSMLWFELPRSCHTYCAAAIRKPKGDVSFIIVSTGTIVSNIILRCRV